MPERGILCYGPLLIVHPLATGTPMRKIALALLLMAACTGADPRSDEVPAPAPGRQAAEFTDPAAPIETRAGQEFTIVLRSNRTTGYSWMLADSLDARLVALVRDDYLADPAPAGIAGSGGRERWTFRALTPGETVIQMKYARAWEQPSPGVETADVRVVIR